jgi:hypothetical protein
VVLHRAAGDVNSAANGVELPFPHPGTGNSHRAGTAASAYNHDHGASTMITALAFKRRLAAIRLPVRSLMPIRNAVSGTGRGDIEERRKEGVQRLLYMDTMNYGTVFFPLSRTWNITRSFHLRAGVREGNPLEATSNSSASLTIAN